MLAGLWRGRGTGVVANIEVGVSGFYVEGWMRIFMQKRLHLLINIR